VTTAIKDSNKDRFDCDRFEPREADFHFLQAAFKRSSWDDIRGEVLKQLAHWHCRRTVLYYNRWIKDRFSVGWAEFRNSCVAKLGEALRKQCEALRACKATDELEKLARLCIKRSCQNAHYDLRRPSGPNNITRLPDNMDIPDDRKDGPSFDDENLVECLSKLSSVDQVIIFQTAQGKSVEAIGRLVHLDPGQVSRRRTNAIAQLRQCLGIDKRE
jgi:hypothetical protein